LNLIGYCTNCTNNNTTLTLSKQTDDTMYIEMICGKCNFLQSVSVSIDAVRKLIN